MPAPTAALEQWETHPLRKISIYFCLATLFLRLSVLPELIYYITHYNTYLLYMVAPPAILSALLMGYVWRTFRSRAAFYWLGFFAWTVLAVPFSTWPGGSASIVISYVRYEGVFLVLLGGLAFNWREVRSVFHAMAAVALVNLVSARLFAKFDTGRLVLTATSSIGNSNDLAAQLLLVLPFLLFFMMGRGRSIVIRIVILALLGYGLWVILGTASRGALIGLAVVFLCLLARASPTQKLLFVAVGGAFAVGAMAILPAATLQRLGSMFGEKHAEATASYESRDYLLRKSIEYTFEHPVFGVGPGQFSSYEGKTSRAAGFHGNWHVTHNAYTEVSSECGLPGFILFTAALGSAMLLVLRTYRVAKREGYPEIANGCFCYLLAMTGYLVAIFFLAQAFTFRLPAMVGIGVTLNFAAMRTMQSDREGQTQQPAALAQQGAIRRR